MALPHFSSSAAGHMHGAEWVWRAMPLERWARAPASTLLIDADAHHPGSRLRCDLHFPGHRKSGRPQMYRCLDSARQQARGSGVTACRRKEEQERKKRMISWPMLCFPFSYFFLLLLGRFWCALSSGAPNFGSLWGDWHENVPAGVRGAESEAQSIKAGTGVCRPIDRNQISFTPPKKIQLFACLP